jgi:hypothetical protein
MGPEASWRIVSSATMIRSSAAGIVIVATLFQGPDRFACFRDRLVAIPPELHGGQAIKFQNELFRY